MSKTLKIVLLAAIALVMTTAFVIYKTASRNDSGTFRDQLGRETRLEDFRGRVVLMNFIYTSCPNEGCDLMSLHFLRLQMLLKDRIGKDLVLLSVSLDPEKDTPEAIRRYAQKLKADPNGWLFLTTSPEYTERLSKEYGVAWKTDPDGSRHHKIVMALLDRKGEKIRVYDNVTEAVERETDELEADIRKLLD